MASLAQVKQKYESAFRVMDQQQVKVRDARPEQGKLYILAYAPSEEAKNKVWDAIKAIDPAYGDLTLDIRIAGESEQTSAFSFSPQTQFEQIAQSQPPSAIARGLADTFRSDQTAPFGQLLGHLFGQSDASQKAGLLNQLFALTPAALAAEVAGLFGGNKEVTPDQAQQVSPQKVEELAERAQKSDPSIIDKASEFYAQHPNIVRTLGVGALTFLMSNMTRSTRGRGSGGS
ncbi:MAG: hypothetical protein ACM336_08110 [Acidobacteriota bacterium]